MKTKIKERLKKNEGKETEKITRKERGEGTMY